MRSHYSKDTLIQALKDVGVEDGDVIFSHISLLNLGFVEGAKTSEHIISIFCEAIDAVLGKNGTFLTPAYSYSYCKGETYNPLTTPSDCGPVSQSLIKNSHYSRSIDPNFSVVGKGKHYIDLINDLPLNSFGQDCLYERLLLLGAKVVNIGLDFFFFTPIHHLEKKISVPYRYDKIFTGYSELEGQLQYQEWVYYVRDIDVVSTPNCLELQRVGIEKDIVHVSPLGLGEIYCTKLSPYFNLAKDMCVQDPWFLTDNAQWIGKDDDRGTD